jgi:hypothetical protein
MRGIRRLKKGTKKVEKGVEITWKMFAYVAENEYLCTIKTKDTEKSEIHGKIGNTRKPSPRREPIRDAT